MFTLLIEGGILDGNASIFRRDSLKRSSQESSPISFSTKPLAHLFETEPEVISSVSKIIVSNGPGSHTGVRVGIATALGLGFAENIPVYGCPLIPAIIECLEEPDALVLLPFGKRDVLLSSLDSFGTRRETAVKLVDFPEKMSKFNNNKVYAPRLLLTGLSTLKNIIPFETSLAETMFRYSEKHELAPPSPIYYTTYAK